MDSMDELKKELELKRRQSPSLFAPLEPNEGHHQRRHHLLEHQAHDLDEKADSKKSSLEHEINSDYGIEQTGILIGSPAVKSKESEFQQRSGQSNNVEQQGEGENLPNAVGVAEGFLSFAEFIKANKEKTLLYFFLSASSGVIILLLACIFYQCRARSKEKKQANLCASRNHQTISVCRLPQDKSGAELSSLIGSSSQSNHTSPLYLDSDDSRNCVRLDNGIVGPSNQSMADYCGVGNGNAAVVVIAVPKSSAVYGPIREEALSEVLGLTINGQHGRSDRKIHQILTSYTAQDTSQSPLL
uniref:Uncharacterized protein n=1 Tax=Ditylenchus dipsaci TaxID=166011 RepID=A0A915DI97_9BILA